MFCKIICMNDGMEFTIIGEDEAQVDAAVATKMELLREQYWDKNKWSFKNREEYKTRCYWHVHTTPMSIFIPPVSPVPGSTFFDTNKQKSYKLEWVEVPDEKDDGNTNL